MGSTPRVTPDTDQWQTRRAARLDARYAQWGLSSLRRVKACGKSVTSKHEAVTVLASGSAADGTRRGGFGGVQSCGSVWACPVCAQKIQARRQTEVAAALAVARKRGWEVLFLTLTMRHDRDHKLKTLWDHLGKAWGSVTTGAGQRAWQADKQEFGIAGYLRLIEVTHGDSGWHVHAHVLLFCDPSEALILQGLGERTGEHGAGFTDDEVNQLGTRMFLRWRKALNTGRIRPSLRRGVDIRRVRSDDKIADYFAKQLYHLKGEGSTAHDVTGSHGKAAKNGNRTPFGILADLIHLERTGELVGDATERDLELWHTFEKASKGRRQLLWARGFRDDILAGMEELDDQDIVEEAPGGDEVAKIAPELWKQIVRRRLIGDVLAMAESDDTGHALRTWLRAGLDFYSPDRRV